MKSVRHRTWMAASVFFCDTLNGATLQTHRYTTPSKSPILLSSETTVHMMAKDVGEPHPFSLHHKELHEGEIKYTDGQIQICKSTAQDV